MNTDNANSYYSILELDNTATPKDIKTTEKPREKTIVFNKTTLLFF